MCRQDFGNSSVPHQPGHLVGRFGREAPEVPLHVVIAKVRIGSALLGSNEMLELHRIPKEEHRRIVPHHVVIAFRRVELQGESTRVAPGVGASPLAGDRGKADQGVRRGARLEDGRLGVRADIRGDLEMTEGPAALGVGLTLRDPFPVEIRHLLYQVVILKEDRAVRADGQRMFVARDRDARVRGRRIHVMVRHVAPFSSGSHHGLYGSVLRRQAPISRATGGATHCTLQYPVPGAANPARSGGETQWSSAVSGRARRATRPAR